MPRASRLDMTTIEPIHIRRSDHRPGGQEGSIESEIFMLGCCCIKTLKINNPTNCISGIYIF